LGGGGGVVFCAGGSLVVCVGGAWLFGCGAWGVVCLLVLSCVGLLFGGFSPTPCPLSSPKGRGELERLMPQLTPLIAWKSESVNLVLPTKKGKRQRTCLAGCWNSFQAMRTKPWRRIAGFFFTRRGKRGKRTRRATVKGEYGIVVSSPSKLST